MHDLEPGDLLCYGPGLPQSGTASDDFRATGLHFDALVAQRPLLGLLPLPRGSVRAVPIR